MAEAYKCDCCGKFYEGCRTKRIIINSSPEGFNDYPNRYDACPDCIESFYLWKESRNPDHRSAFEDKEDQ